MGRQDNCPKSCREGMNVIVNGPLGAIASTVRSRGRLSGRSVTGNVQDSRKSATRQEDLSESS